VPHPADVFRHCPRCGAAGFAAGRDNSLRCGACTLAWYYNSACAADVICERADGHILVTRRAREPRQGLLDLPGGFVSPDERVEDAARREVREEVGLDLHETELTWFGSFPNRYEYGGVLYFAVDLIFRAAVGAAPRLAAAADDVSHAQFVDPLRVDLAEVGLDSTRAALAAYQTWRKRA
jgi:ADP-ribose pyrophosphatase YjhB (NUDIX family)